MNTIANTLNSIATKIVSGVRMLVAGIMAMAGFIVKLFKDIALLMWEFGQWFIGMLKAFANKIVQAFKFVIKTISWVTVKALEIVVGFFVDVAEKLLGVSLGDGALSVNIDTPRGYFRFYLDTKELYYEEFGDTLWSIIITLYFSRYNARIGETWWVNITFAIPGILVFASRINMDTYPASELYASTLKTTRQAVTNSLAYNVTLAILHRIAIIWSIVNSLGLGSAVATLAAFIVGTLWHTKATAPVNVMGYLLSIGVYLAILGATF